MYKKIPPLIVIAFAVFGLAVRSDAQQETASQQGTASTRVQSAETTSAQETQPLSTESTDPSTRCVPVIVPQSVDLSARSPQTLPPTTPPAFASTPVLTFYNPGVVAPAPALTFYNPTNTSTTPLTFYTPLGPITSSSSAANISNGAATNVNVVMTPCPPGTQPDTLAR